MANKTLFGYLWAFVIAIFALWFFLQGLQWLYQMIWVYHHFYLPYFLRVLASLVLGLILVVIAYHKFKK